MSKSFTFTLLLVCLMFLQPTIAQESTDQKKEEKDTRIDLVESAVQQREKLPLPVEWKLDPARLPTFIYYNFPGIASEDGHYRAQDKLELQTYNDLGITYQYLGETWLRKQLKLPQEQGILLTTVAEAEQGHQAGLRAGDIILKVDDVAVDTQYDFVIALSKKRGKERTAKLLRDGIELDTRVRLDPAILDSTGKRLIIGVNIDAISEPMKAQLQTDGVLILGLTDDGPAKAAGLLINDVIARIDGVQISDIASLRKAVEGSKGTAVTVDYVRGGKFRSVKLTPKEVAIEAQSNLVGGAYWDLVDPQLNANKARWRAILNQKIYDNALDLTEFEQQKNDQPNKKSVDEQLNEILKKINSLEEKLSKLEGKDK